MILIHFKLDGYKTLKFLIPRDMHKEGMSYSTQEYLFRRTCTFLVNRNTGRSYRPILIMFDKDLTPEFVNEHHKTARNKLHPVKGEVRISQDLAKEKTEVLLGISEYVVINSILDWRSIKNAIEQRTLNLEINSPYAYLLQRE